MYEYVHVCMYTMYMTGPHGTGIIAVSCCHVGDESQIWVLCQNNKKFSYLLSHLYSNHGFGLI